MADTINPLALSFVYPSLTRPIMNSIYDDRPRKGKCAMRGSCGKTSMFGADLPCPDSGNADEVSVTSNA
jgi:hypothetical protein